MDIKSYKRYNKMSKSPESSNVNIKNKKEDPDILDKWKKDPSRNPETGRKIKIGGPKYKELVSKYGNPNDNAPKNIPSKTPLDCEEWKKNPEINPTTGRSIKVKGPTYKKLLKECGNPNDNNAPKNIPSKTPLDCEEWKKNPEINPTTGRSIKVKGPTYKKLLKECGDPNNQEIPKQNTRLSRDSNEQEIPKQNTQLSYSIKECEEWLLNPTVNPKTKRKIIKNKGVYNKILNNCEKYNLIETKASSKKSSVKSNISSKKSSIGPSVKRSSRGSSRSKSSDSARSKSSRSSRGSSRSKSSRSSRGSSRSSRGSSRSSRGSSRSSRGSSRSSRGSSRSSRGSSRSKSSGSSSSSRGSSRSKSSGSSRSKSSGSSDISFKKNSIKSNISSEKTSNYIPPRIVSIKGKPFLASVHEKTRLELFEEMAEKKGFTVTNVPLDGNCMLSAVGSYFNITAKELRKYLVEYTEKCNLKSEVFNFDENFVNKLKIQGEWCNEETIELIVLALNSTIHILNEKTNTIITLGSGDNVLFLGYMFNFHYVIITEKGKSQKIYTLPSKVQCLNEPDIPLTPRTSFLQEQPINDEEINRLVSQIHDIKNKTNLSTFQESERLLLKTIGLV